MDACIPFLIRAVLGDRTARAHYADNEGQLGRLQVLTHIADEVREIFAVARIPARLAARGIGAAVDHIVPALKPHKARQLIAGLGIVGGIHAFDVTKHFADVLEHQPIIHAGAFSSSLTLGSDILVALFEIIDLLLVELIRPRARRPEVCVQRFATPRGLDQKNWFADVLLHGNPEGQFRSDLRFAPARAVADGQLPFLHARFLRGIDRGNPDLIMHLGRAISILDCLQQRHRLRVHAQMRQRAHGRVALHV